MAEKVYEKGFTRIAYNDDMTGNIVIRGMDVATGQSGTATIPALHLLDFIANNMMNENSSIFHGITQSEFIPIEKIRIDFEAVRRIEKTEEFEHGKA